MKTKTKKNYRKSSAPRRSKQSVIRQPIVLWSSVLVLVILAVTYQIVKANSNNGLPLTAPSGSLAREAQLDRLEQQQQAQADAVYVSQQSSNAQGDTTELNSLNGVMDDATR